MYRLTPIMEQRLKNQLAEYHKLFSGGRCQGWELEELITNAIKADMKASHHPKWTEGGHDDKEDILVVINGSTHQIQVKSGQIKNSKNGLRLALSGHRLTRFKADFKLITNYLNSRPANIISVPYRRVDSDKGREHIYRLCYIPIDLLKGVQASDWHKNGASYIAHNSHGVELSISPSMSWQIWWKIPIEKLELKEEFIFD